MNTKTRAWDGKTSCISKTDALKSAYPKSNMKVGPIQISLGFLRLSVVGIIIIHEKHLTISNGSFDSETPVLTYGAIFVCPQQKRQRIIRASDQPS